ncbi:Probable Co/Zn/Cd efflux system membrane fusion protein [hydrothermal vent metagenome]|uniref:Probable Co/Zn/Cd efflux system membrane fusion protein n=1 Tax=hydrothermal vent metagenome TaxID=652676 RepID=A0A3B1DR25_9ZZZZ
MSQENSPQTKKSLFTNLRNALSPLQFVVLSVIAVGLLLSVFFLGMLGNWIFGGTTSGANGQHAHADGGSKTQMWSCSMHPQIQKNGPGKCPICGMDLIPVKASTGRMLGLRQVAISPEARALMQIQVAPVERKNVEALIRMVGKVDYDETRLKYITAWVPGRLDKLFVDFTGVTVNKGHHLVYIYSEELYAAQQELIETAKSAKKYNNNRTGGIDLLESSREKLRLLGLTKEQVQAIEKQEKPSDHMTIYSPMSGIVIEKLRQEGDRVRTGDRIYTVADLSEVWVKMDAYESDLKWVKYGQKVTFSTEAYPGEVFKGSIAFIDPVLNEKTRTVKVRVNVLNPQGKLKPEMFVRATVKVQVAAGGKVVNPSFAGKWISPMHPEVMSNKPGKCPVCGMDLVRAESLGYTSSVTKSKPLVIPASAALLTGTRAIVYVEMPSQPEGLDAAYQILSAALDSKKMIDIRSAFRSVKSALDKPNKRLRTSGAKQFWKKLSAPVKAEIEKGVSVKEIELAQEIFTRLSEKMEAIHKNFVPPNQPTFLGREIVLGARAGNYYLVEHGLSEGELVVTNGNFKIDSALQIQAKPSMMTPDGGGSNDTKIDLPLTFRKQILQLQDAHQNVIVAVKKKDLKQIQATFTTFGNRLKKVDKNLLSDHPQMLWEELAMLLGNDAFEGKRVKELKKVPVLFQSLQKHMQQIQEKLGQIDDLPQSLDVPIKFQEQLNGLWQVYLAMGNELANDDYKKASRQSAQLKTAMAAIDMKLLTGQTEHIAWMKELANLKIIQANLSSAKEIKPLRAAFRSFSGEMQVLAMQFGFGQKKKVYQLHCPMAFGGKGAIWLQKDKKTRNPYYGSNMLECADRTEVISGD